MPELANFSLLSDACLNITTLKTWEWAMMSLLGEVINRKMNTTLHYILIHGHEVGNFGQVKKMSTALFQQFLLA